LAERSPTAIPFAGVPPLQTLWAGKPIDQPLIASAQLVLQPDVALANVRSAVESVIADELAKICEFTRHLTHGKWTVW
jgi:S-adenosylmethionine synthetase